MPSHALSMSRFDFNETPFLVIWEITQACALACRHCRASAIERRDPNELTLEQGKSLLEQVRGMGTPVCVLSGGDPLRREDINELVRHGARLGLRMATIPAACEDLTRDQLVQLKDAGLAQLAFSLDGSTAAIHDDFRQVEGTYDRTMRAIEWAHELELPLQINTTFSQYNYDDVDGMIALVRRLGIVFWEVFSLVPVGRGEVMKPMTAEQHESLFARLYLLSQNMPFVIKVTEAPHYRRYVMQQRDSAPQHPDAQQASGSAIPAQLARDMSEKASFGKTGKGINAGKGFCFVSHTGEVFPSGFFPNSTGNVKNTPLSALYRDTTLFRELRDPSRLKGRCGICEYADICGGSRARALATTGDPFAEDAACVYIPEPL